MKITIEIDKQFDDDCHALANAQKRSIEDITERLLLAELKPFLLGKMAGQKEAHESAMKTIGEIGKRS